jgi:hypothetical protein
MAVMSDAQMAFRSWKALLSSGDAMMKLAPRYVLAAVLCIGSLSAGEIKDEPGSHLDILHNGKPLARYMYAYDTSSDESSHNTYKTYHHVLDTDGKETLTKGPGGKFTHHRGLFIGWSRLRHADKSHDTWHMKTKTAQIHQEFVKQDAGDDQTTVVSKIRWVGSDGETVLLEETRTVTVHHDDAEAYALIDFVSELKAVNGKVELQGDPEHAGMQYRPHNEVAENKSAKYLFPAEGIDPRKDRDLPWAAETYELRGKQWTVQHMNHADNPKGTIYSAYRDYGRFGAFPTATIEDGDALTLRYRIRITSGEAPPREVLSAQSKKYSAD